MTCVSVARSPKRQADRASTRITVVIYLRPSGGGFAEKSSLSFGRHRSTQTAVSRNEYLRPLFPDRWAARNSNTLMFAVLGKL
jgi:hypothetical protein